MEQPTKKRKLDDHALSSEPKENILKTLLHEQQWIEAAARVSAHPEEAQTRKNPTPLALACRLGAPVECVRRILDAAPEKVRHVIDARGTPLHEAIVCENVGAAVIEVLLQADEKLGQNGIRATLQQDVDGFVPIHILIRRRFQAHILNEESVHLMQILEMLVRSCPEAVLIPDRGEYEEPPIVYALKANIYAPALVSDDNTIARVEREIYEMVACLLQYCPQAASNVFTGYRGQYTALHSAVFHGRDTRTIELLLRTEERVRQHGTTNCLLANTQGELPLHFCAMRGERPRSVALIARAAPRAVVKRDASGLSPLHWLWARFISSLLALDGSTSAEDSTVGPLRITEDSRSSAYDAFASLEQGDFQLDIQLIKRMDPPVDFLRMRHIPIEVLGPEDSVQWANSTVEALQELRDRYNTDKEGNHVWSRRQCVIALFWTKVVSLVEASSLITNSSPRGDSVLVHKAFACPACTPAVARMVAMLFPGELSQSDDRGKLPLHYAASRPFHAGDWPQSGGNRSPAQELLHNETFLLIRTALELVPKDAVSHRDNTQLLPLHDYIDNICTSASQQPVTEESATEAMKVLKIFVEKNPGSLNSRDGSSKLFPFLQATARASESQDHTAHASNFDLPLSFTYELLRENPATMRFQS